jgi:hypothetical protein
MYSPEEVRNGCGVIGGNITCNDKNVIKTVMQP